MLKFIRDQFALLTLIALLLASAVLMTQIMGFDFLMVMGNLNESNTEL